MNSFDFQKFSLALKGKGKHTACKLLREADPTCIRTLSPLILRYELYRHVEFWKHTPTSILLDLSAQEDLFVAMRKAYLQQDWGRGGKFHPEFTTRLLELDPAGTLEAIRTTKAFLNDRFWKELPLESEICQNEEVKAVLDTFEGVREFYQPMLADCRAKIAEIEKEMDGGLLEFLILATIYYEEARYAEHARPSEMRPLRLHIIQESINRISQRVWKSRGKEDIHDVRGGIELFARTIQKFEENPDLWKNFRMWMLMERFMIGLQLSLDYQCTYGGDIRLTDGKIQQELPWQFLNELEQVRLRSALEEGAIATSYENFNKAIAWRKGGDLTKARLSQGPSSLSHWQFAGFSMRLQVNGKSILPWFLLSFYDKLMEHVKAPFMLFRMQFYRFLEEHPEHGDLNFIQKISLFARKTGMIIGLPMMLPKQELLQRFTKHSKSDPDREMIHDSFALLIREYEEKPSVIDLQGQPLHIFGDLLCLLEFTIPPLGHSGNLQNLIFKSWQKAGDTTAIQQRSTDFEKIVARCFDYAGFHTQQRIVLRQDGNEVAEIDVLAWKGNEIMIVEAKSTYIRTSLCSHFAYRDKLEEAGTQLDRILFWIKRNRAEFLKTIGFPDENGDPLIRTLIVSSSQEANGETWGKGKHLKTSNFDLIHLLTNVKVIRKCFLTQGMINLLGSEPLAADVMEQLLREVSLVGASKFKEFLERIELETLVAMLPTLNIWMDQKQVTPEFVLNSLKSRVIWGELSLEEEIQQAVERFVEPPTEEDLSIGKMLEKDGDTMTQNGDDWAATEAYRMALQKGNLGVAIKWLETVERLHAPRNP